MTEEEQQIEQEAVRWVRRPANQRAILERFASLEMYKPNSSPLMVFTAGSPGAGKTEFIKGFSGSIERLGTKPAIIDPDAVRELLPGYIGSNSYLFQRAISIAVDELFWSVLKSRQSAFVDGTLSDYRRAYKNIEKVIEQYDTVMIAYIFQHPAIAWHFTQLREAVEGRNIRQEDFIDRFLGAKDTVNKLKAHFGDKITLHVILKDYRDTKENKAVAEVFTDVASVEECLPFDYTKSNVEESLKNEIV